MPRRRSGRRKKSKRGSSKGVTPITATSYHGPILDPAARANLDIIETTLLWDVAITGAGTAINPTFSFTNPSNCVDWSDFSSSYDQYRVLAVELDYSPNSGTRDPALTYTPLYVVVDRDTSTALSSVTGADQYESIKLEDLAKKWRRIWRMAQVNESTFTNTQAPINGGAFKLWASGVSNSTYGRCLVQYRVQFMGRGI